MESPCADYRIDGWCLPFPREWPLSLDREAQPPQLIFEVAGEPVTVYVSTWNLCRPETGEVPGAETVCALMAQALAQQGAGGWRAIRTASPRTLPPAWAGVPPATAAR